MNLRSEWKTDSSNSLSDIYYNKNETVQNVIDNFDFRRMYSSEGYSVTVDGVAVQVIVQDHANPINESDVDKKILLPMDTEVHTGSYIVFRNQTWIINSNVNIVDDAYKACQMQYCTYTLPFQHPTTGAILSYPCIDETSSSVGLDENKFITTGDATHTIKLPFDDNTQLLIEGCRLIVDKRNIDVPTVYKVTKVNTTEYNYGDKGLIELVLAQDKFNESADNLELKICNYFEPTVTPPEPDPTVPTIVTTISCTSHSDFANKTKLGVNYTFATTFKNELGVPVENTQPVYSVDNAYDNKVVLTDNGDGTCSLKVGTARDLSLCTKQFTFTCMDMRSGFSSSILLTIVGLY